MMSYEAPADVAPWWEADEPDPWDLPPSKVPPSGESSPAEDSDEAGWGDESDEAGWGDESDEAGWGDESDEAGWGDESDEAGFGSAGSVTEPGDDRPAGWWSTLPLSAGGAVESRQSLWMERLRTTPLASARQSVDLEVRLRQGIVRGRAAMHSEVDFAYLPAREIWDQTTTQTYGYQVVPRELYVSVAPGPFELALGRQTVAWGDGMLLSTVDVIAPRDNREPGLADLEDLRLPVTMARVGWYPGSHRLELHYVPEFNHGFRSPPQGPYGFADALVDQAPDLKPSDVFEDPTGGLLGGLIDALAGDQFNEYVDELVASKSYQWNHLQPTWDLSQPQFYGRWKFSGQGYDVALHAASTLDKQGVLSFPGLRTFVEQTNLDLDLDHLRYTVLGIPAPP